MSQRLRTEEQLAETPHRFVYHVADPKFARWMRRRSPSDCAGERGSPWMVWSCALVPLSGRAPAFRRWILAAIADCFDRQLSGHRTRLVGDPDFEINGFPWLRFKRPRRTRPQVVTG